MIFGYKQSELDGSEHIFGATSTTIPAHYSYKRFMPKILNQGNEPICVPCSISAYLNWRENLADGSKRDNQINYYGIYDSKTTVGDGMSFKDAFKYLRHEGVRSKKGVLKIDEYSMVKSIQALRTALIVNGPCVGALPVYNNSKEFWRKKPGQAILGGHAISIVGYDEKGFFIRNSWGNGFGDNGYTYITNEEFSTFYEIWTIL